MVGKTEEFPGFIAAMTGPTVAGAVVEVVAVSFRCVGINHTLLRTDKNRFQRQKLDDHSPTSRHLLPWGPTMTLGCGLYGVSQVAR